ncbi:DUF58 domain-containing protein [Nocardia carnea]|uniref:DUF58 domain-containing protein n=1 Tax=Nocardia carnea TaxID=37328 RepID=UPI00245900E9|nr:DUF58 domain-containing protein [Nocardia carnea]
MVVTGRLFGTAVAAAVFVTVVSPSWFGVLLTTALLCALAATDRALTADSADVVLERTELTVLRLGAAAEIEIAVTNTGPRAVRGRLWDDWPGSTGAAGREHRLNLPPGHRVRVRTTLTPTRRGDRAAGPVTVRLFGPLGLAGHQFQRVVPARVRALPPFHSERLLGGKIKRLHHLEGRNAADLRGQGTEFDSFREYVPGDDVRTIDWRATARATDVLVRTWRPERNRQVLMLLDTGRISAARVGGGTRLDNAIEAALLLGSLAATAGDMVGLLAYDREVRAEVRIGVGRGVQPKLMHALAGVTPALVDTDSEGLVRAAIHRARRRSLIVWFTGLDSAAVTENLLPVLPVLAERHRVLIVSVTDPEITAAAADRSDLRALYRAAAAESRLAEQAVVQESLRRMGIAVIAAAGPDLPGALADEYLELKRSAAL